MTIPPISSSSGTIDPVTVKNVIVAGVFILGVAYWFYEVIRLSRRPAWGEALRGETKPVRKAQLVVPVEEIALETEEIEYQGRVPVP
jgi:hypothetical protein